MAGEDGDPDDKTEAPTSRQLQRAQDEGRLPVSREVTLLAGLAAVTLIFMQFNGRIGREMTRTLSTMLDRGLEMDPAATAAAATAVFLALAAAFSLPVLLGSVAATLAQTRLSLRKGALTPDFSRISPRKGLARMFGSESLIETAKSLVKLAIVGGAVVWVVRRDLPRLEAMSAAPLEFLPGHLATIAIRLLIATILAQTVIAAADFFFLWRQHQQQLRMSRSDVRDEQKETDGDPAIKMRIRRIRMSRARQRMLSAVRTATVVVTNPTHFAVALAYDSGANGVPQVVAKGVDTVAARIREAAREHGIPIVENPPLARTLHTLPLNARIPPELYRAVAELIAYVWRLGQRRLR